jgi:hypothetical protein
MEQRAAEKARVVAELAEAEAAKAAATAAEQERRAAEAAAAAEAADDDDGQDYDEPAANEPVDVKDIQQLLEVQRQRQRKAARQRQAQKDMSRRTMLTEN